MADDLDSNSSNSKSRVRLDLGLSSFVHGAGEIVKKTSEEVNDLASLLKNSVELNSATSGSHEQNLSIQQEDNSITEYEKLAAASKWPELAKLCEKKLSETPEIDYEAKLWWIKSQFDSHAIPVTILAPSLDSVARALLGLEISPIPDSQQEVLKKLKPLCVDLLIEIAKVLEKNSDYELALLFGERAFRASSEKRAELLSLIQNVRDSIAAKGERPESDILQKQIERLEQEFATSARDEKKKLPSAFVVFEDSKNGTARNSSVIQKSSGNKTSSQYTSFILLLLVFLGIYAYLNNFFQEQLPAQISEDLGSSDQTLTVAQNLLAPEVERVEGLQHLDALFYDINNKKETQPTAAPVSDQVQAATSVAAVDQSSPAVIAQPIAQQELQPQNPSSAIQQNSQPKPPVAKLPQRDRDTLEKTIRDRLGHSSAHDKETVNTNYPVERRDASRYDDANEKKEEMPEIDFPPYRSNSDRGREQQAKPVHNSTEKYVVIARTKVMQEPSYWATSFADLYEGDTIQVEEKFGKWLRVRTPRGKTGYVLSQDAERD